MFLITKIININKNYYYYCSGHLDAVKKFVNEQGKEEINAQNKDQGMSGAMAAA